jgi:signal transduction histidine kinase
MNNSFSAEANISRSPVPFAASLAVVSAICLALAGSAGYSYFSLSRLRNEYLSNRAHEIASLTDTLARGPGRRNNAAFWQNLLNENFDSFGPSLAFIALEDRAGTVLASRSKLGDAVLSASAGLTSDQGTRLYILDYPLVSPRQFQAGPSQSISSWRMRIGLYTSDADFIYRQAAIQIAVTVVAILILSLLTFALLRTLKRVLWLRAREQSERHLKALGSMAAVLAHEIRNPLGAMKGLTQLAQEEIPRDHSTQVLMKTVVNEAERLEKLVSDLLNFAQPRQSDLREFDYMKLIADVGDLLEPRFREDGKRLEVAVDPKIIRIRSDEDGLRQVLLNVLLNAIDFSPPGGSVILRVRYQSRQKELVTEVDDSGPGIGTENAEELFEPFATRKPKGTGLGLAISRQLVENLGGSINLSNLPGGGARCSIRLHAEPISGQNTG